MDLRPSLDQPLLRPRKVTAEKLDRIKAEHTVELLVHRMKVRPMMGALTSMNIRMTIPKNRESSGTRQR